MNPDIIKLVQTMAQSPSFDGQPAKLAHLTNASGMTASFMDIGATWLSCTVPMPEGAREVLLRSANMDEHMKQTAYFGSIIGRFANRIAKGQFSVDGVDYQLDINNGENALHGGLVGFDKRRWAIEKQTDNQVCFALRSVDGDQGYPGNLDVMVTYTLDEENQLTILYQAHCDASCPVNLTNHAYFNLAGEGSAFNALEHSLQIKAPYYLPADATAIPTGDYKPVVGNSFDFTSLKLIGSEFLQDEDQKLAAGYDHSFVFSEDIVDGKTPVAKLVSPNQDLTMIVKTTKPAMQVYTGNYLLGSIGASKAYQNHDGVALETQYFPDSPNKEQWQQRCPLLLPEQTYYHQTCYQFEF
ncbi:TPA: galactose-1-epimerase [Photobacterium damselae]